MAWLATRRLISTMLFSVGAADPVTFASVILLLGAGAFLACYVPARWATKVDPLPTLRCE